MFHISHVCHVRRHARKFMLRDLSIPTAHATTISLYLRDTHTSRNFRRRHPLNRAGEARFILLLFAPHSVHVTRGVAATLYAAAVTSEVPHSPHTAMWFFVSSTIGFSTEHASLSSFSQRRRSERTRLLRRAPNSHWLGAPSPALPDSSLHQPLNRKSRRFRRLPLCFLSFNRAPLFTLHHRSPHRRYIVRHGVGPPSADAL
jgi:hypothetical protein